MSDKKGLNESISTIFSALSTKSRVVNISKGCFISINNIPESECILLHRGYTFLRRTDDRLVIGNFNGPTVFGFNKYQNVCSNFFLEAMTDVEIEFIPSSVFFKEISNNNLWEPLLDVMMALSAAMLRKNYDLSRHDSWSIIRWLLKDLNAEPDFIRDQICVFDYIQQRTHLSRSGIMKYLSRLRKHHIIKMDKGRLVSINGLPEALN